MKLGLLAMACAFAAVPGSWTGTWVLNVQKSTFGPILLPGVPEGFKVVSQTFTITEGAGRLKVSGETVFTDRVGSHSAHDDVSLPSMAATPSADPSRFPSSKSTIPRFKSSPGEHLQILR